jgi:hypothetical protein
MTRRRLLAERLLALALAGWLLFNFPLLTLALAGGAEGLVLGWPRLALLLFVAWAGLIVLLAWWMERRGPDDEDLQR